MCAIAVPEEVPTLRGTPAGYTRWEPTRLPGQTDEEACRAFYYVSPGEKRACYCRICFEAPKALKMGGGGGVYNFKLHLARMHPEFLTRADREALQQNDQLVVKRSRKSTTDMNGMRRIDEMLASCPGVELVEELALLVTMGGLPMRFVEAPALRSFIRALCPSMQGELPGRNAVSARVKKLHAFAMKDISERIARARAPLSAAQGRGLGELRNQCSVTLDEWTSTGVQSYMSTTVHFIDENWRLPVACSPLSRPHTAANLFEALRSNLKMGDLDVRDMTGITTDGASNVIAMTNDSRQQRVRCAAHGIQLALSCAANNAEFQAFMRPVNRFYAALAKSPQRREHLARELRAMGLPVLMPVYPVKTRWNSHYDALRRFVDIKPALGAFTHRVLGLTDQVELIALQVQAGCTFSAAPYVLETLQPFVHWTTRLSSSSSVTLSLVPRAIGELLALSETPIMTDDPHANVANELRARLAAELRRIFRNVLDPWSNDILFPVHIARFLDPRTIREVVIQAFPVDEEGDHVSAPYTRESVAIVKRTHGILKECLPCARIPERSHTWLDDDGVGPVVHEVADNFAAEMLKKDIHAYLQRTVGTATTPIHLRGGRQMHPTYPAWRSLPAVTWPCRRRQPNPSGFSPWRERLSAQCGPG